MLVMSTPHEVRQSLRAGRQNTADGKGRGDGDLDKVRSVAAAAMALKELAGDSNRSLESARSQTDRSEMEEDDDDGDQKQPARKRSVSSPTSRSGMSMITEEKSGGNKTSGDHNHTEEDEDDFDLDDDLNSSLMHMNFPRKLMELLSNPELREIVSWLPHGKSFFIMNPKKFSTQVLPRYFNKQAEYRSFTRRLLRWGFKRISKGNETGAYKHDLFQRDKPHLCSQIVTNHRTSGGSSKDLSTPKSSTKASKPPTRAEPKRQGSKRGLLKESELVSNVEKKPRRPVLSKFKSDSSRSISSDPTSFASHHSGGGPILGLPQQQNPQHLQNDSLLTAAAAAAAGLAEPWQIELLRMSQQNREHSTGPSEAIESPSSNAAAAASASALEAAILYQRRLATFRAMGIAEAPGISAGINLTGLGLPTTSNVNHPFGGASSISRQLLSSQNLLSAQYRGQSLRAPNQSMMPLLSNPFRSSAEAQLRAAAHQYPSPRASAVASREAGPMMPPREAFAIVQAAQDALSRSNRSLSGEGVVRPPNDSRASLYRHLASYEESQEDWDKEQNAGSDDTNRRPLDPELLRAHDDFVQRRRNSAA